MIPLISSLYNVSSFGIYPLFPVLSSFFLSYYIFLFLPYNISPLTIFFLYFLFPHNFPCSFGFFFLLIISSYYFFLRYFFFLFISSSFLVSSYDSSSFLLHTIFPLMIFFLSFLFPRNTSCSSMLF
jgi:signal transduction histidine kinase